VFADWGELEYVGPAYEWDEEIERGSMADRSFTIWYLKDGVVKAALTWGRSADLEAGRRLIADGLRLDDRQRGALADPDSNLEADIR
jgi:3-phenylpropionate/trans-cinnamate dioxygenase ferredoxin reductase subunit